MTCLKHLWNEGKKWLVRGFQAVERRVKTWTQPAPDRAIKGVVSDLFRSRKDLIAENALLRPQVIILNCQQQGRVQLTPLDRRVLVVLAHHVDGTPFGEGSRFLLCDNDGKYGSLFDHAVDGAGITLIHTPPYAPQANAICERFLDSVRRELLDHILVLSESHARRLAKEYVLYFNHARPHQGIDGQIPIPSPSAFLIPPGDCSLRRIPVLNGLHHDYQWAA